MLILELNPLLMVNQGFGVSLEYQLRANFSVGAETQFYFQNPYDTNGVVAKREIYTFAPKVNYYLFSTLMTGPFVGLTFFFSESQSRIYDAGLSAHSNVFFVAPSAHLGYRFVTENRFTLSAYVGAGIKSLNNTFPSDSIPAARQNNSDWVEAASKLNNRVTRIQPDFGITLGYDF